METVSIIIPVHNMEAHLRQCLDSVMVQTLSDLQIICVDDGSTDDSPQILLEYAAKDDRFQIVTQSNAGPGSARNAGFTSSTGEYLIFLDSDDWFEPNFLELMVRQAKGSGADVTICRAVEFDTDTGRELPSKWMLKTDDLPESLTFSPQDIPRALFRCTWGWPWDKLYRRAYLEAGGFCYPDLPNSEDLSFVFSSLAAAERLSVIDVTLVHHRINRKTSVSNSRARHPEAPYQAIKLLEADLKRRGLYACYEQGFLNWAMEFLIWNTASMADEEVQKECFPMLRQVWLRAFPFQDHPASYYRPFAYVKFLMARFFPRRAFFGAVKAYYKAKERFSHEGS